MAENFEIYGLEKFIKDINKMDSGIKEELQKLVDKYGGLILRDVKRKTPVDTGQLRRSWQLEKGDLYVKIFNNTSYSIFIEFGHRTRGGKSYVEGVYMLKTTFEKQVKNFESDLEKLLEKYGFK